MSGEDRSFFPPSPQPLLVFSADFHRLFTSGSDGKMDGCSQSIINAFPSDDHVRHLFVRELLINSREPDLKTVPTNKEVFLCGL